MPDNVAGSLSRLCGEKGENSKRKGENSRRKGENKGRKGENNRRKGKNTHLALNFKGQSNHQGEGLRVIQGHFPGANPKYFDIQAFSYKVSKQIFFRLALEVDPFPSRVKIRGRLRTLEANRTIKEKALESSKGIF